MTLRIDKAGRIVLPKPVRDRLGIKAGVDLDLPKARRDSCSSPRSNALPWSTGTDCWCIAASCPGRATGAGSSKTAATSGCAGWRACEGLPGNLLSAVGERVRVFAGAHGLAELYVVPTRTPLTPRIHRAEARQMIEKSVLSRVSVIALTAAEYRRIFGNASRRRDRPPRAR